jgi:hypothetical protein
VRSLDGYSVTSDACANAVEMSVKNKIRVCSKPSKTSGIILLNIIRNKPTPSAWKKRIMFLLRGRTATSRTLGDCF